MPTLIEMLAQQRKINNRIIEQRASAPKVTVSKYSDAPKKRGRPRKKVEDDASTSTEQHIATDD